MRFPFWPDHEDVYIYINCVVKLVLSVCSQQSVLRILYQSVFSIYCCNFMYFVLSIATVMIYYSVTVRRFGRVQKSFLRW